MRYIVVSQSIVVAVYDHTITAPKGCLILAVPEGTPVEVGQAWEVSLEDAKAARIAQAKVAADAVMAPLAARFSDYERQTWAAQLAEAKAILADPTLDKSNYPTIAGIIAVTGETAADFAAQVVKNNTTWTMVSAYIIGQRQAFVAAVKACATVADVLAVPLAISLPG